MVASRFTGFLPPEANRLSLLDWGMKFVPHYLRNKPSKMHEWISKNEPDFDKRGQKKVVIGPREGAKSTIGALILTLRRAVSGRESYIILCADTVTQAVEHLKSIKDELETNEALAHEYPAATGMGPIWQDKYIQLRNGCVIRAVGTLSRIRGFRKRQHRPSMIVLDDPENDEHITSSRMRDRTWSWLTRTLLPMGDSNTNFLGLGTAIHRDCLVMKLLRTPGWKSYRDGTDRPAPFKAIIDWPKRMDLWQQWERIYHDVDDPDAEDKAQVFYQKNRKVMDLGSALLWPDREPLYYLMKMRAQMGHQSFEAEKQSNPLNPETCEWPEEYFAGEDLWFDKWPSVSEHAARVIALDPSKGRSDKHGDYSAFAKLVVDHRGVFWFDIDMERRSTDRIVSDGVAIIRKFRPQKVGVESNQFQSLLADNLLEALRDADLDAPIEQLDNRVKKIVRIRRLSPLFAQRRIRFRAGRQGTVRTVEQLRDFPNGDHDDGPDAMEMATRVAMDMLGDAVKIDDGIGDTIEVAYA